MSNRQIPVLSPLTYVTPLVTKFFDIGITVYEYKFDPEEQKLWE